MTVADEFVGGCAVVRNLDEGKLRTAAQWVAQRLVSPPAPTVLQMRRLAERYVFEDSPSDAVQEIRRMGGDLDYGIVLESAGLVNNPVWLEMPVRYDDSGRRVRLGAMIEQDGDKNLIVFVLKDPEILDGRPLVMGYVSCPSFPLQCDHNKIPIDVHAWCTRQRPSADDVGTYIFDVTDALFLLCTPRTHETREIRHDRKLQVARERRGKPPLLEYRRVSLFLGKTRAHSGGGGGGGGGKKAAHRVSGHVRVYRKVYGKDEMRERPLIKFVPEHWRGDAKLGVILHERTVKR